MFSVLLAGCAERALPIPLLADDLSTSKAGFEPTAVDLASPADLTSPADLVLPGAVEVHGWPGYSGDSVRPVAGVVFAYPVTIDKPGVLDRLGVVAAEPGGQARLALYRDEAGAPGEVVFADEASRDLVDGATGRSEVIVPDQPLVEGKYWIAFRTGGEVLAGIEPPSDSVVRCRSTSPLPVDLAWPASFGPSTCGSSLVYNLYARVRQGGAAAPVADLGEAPGTLIEQGWPIDFESSVEVPAHRRMLRRIEVPVAGVLTGLGLVAAEATDETVMALYDDEAAHPGRLVVQTMVPRTFAPGRALFDITDVWLPAGSYWLGVWSSGPLVLGSSASTLSPFCAYSGYLPGDAWDRVAPALGDAACGDARSVNVFVQTRTLEE